ncbi:flippase [Thermococcus sp.]
MDEVNAALQRVARGTGIVFFGSIIGTLLAFISRTLIARHFERAQYGTFNLALTLLNIGLIIALMGFPSGLSREISRYRRESPGKINFLVSSALMVSVSASLLLVLVYFVFAPWFSAVLNDPNLTYALRYVSLALPFSVVSRILIALSRGFDRVRENFYYQKILSPLLYMLVVLVVVLGGFSFRILFIGYVLVQAIIALLILFELKRIGLFEFIPRVDRNLTLKLVFFSIPLMLAGILGYIMNWTDTLMLGYYLTPDVVGLYNSAAPLSRFIPIFLSSAGFLFMPIATGFYAKGKLRELKHVYTVITRWVFLPTFPLFLLLAVFPEQTITFLFGPKYSGAAPALQILALGFMFHTLLGLNGMSLVAIGEPKMNLFSTLFAVLANVPLNILLIPLYGIEGAALATVVAYVVSNAFNSWWLYRKVGVHPFNRSYTLQMVVAGLITLLIMKVAPVNATFLTALIIVGIAFFLFLLSILLLKTPEREDIELLRAIGRRFGLHIDPLIGFLEKFST